ncbi:hypothetical protein ABZ705_22015 [Streptomyces sp. NPDC006984]|uniref:hypothetical protein n=1 Tax=Streptomyces sp. NPDC006984 TaxID=3155463 RepID=UPI0033F30E5D
MSGASRATACCAKVSTKEVPADRLGWSSLRTAHEVAAAPCSAMPMLLITQGPVPLLGSQPFFNQAPPPDAAAETPQSCSAAMPPTTSWTWTREAGESGESSVNTALSRRSWSDAVVSVSPHNPSAPGDLSSSSRRRFARARPSPPPMASHRAVAAALSLSRIISAACSRSSSQSVRSASWAARSRAARVSTVTTLAVAKARPSPAVALAGPSGPPPPPPHDPRCRPPPPPARS